MGRVPATEFKAKCLELMDRVAERHETFVITKRGKPVAKLVPVEPRPRDGLFGWLRGQAWEIGDIVAPAVPAGDWALVKEAAAGPAPRRPGRRRPGKTVGRRR